MDATAPSQVKNTGKVEEDLQEANVTAHVEGSGEAWGCCPKRLRGFITPEYRHELVQLCKLAGPVVRLKQLAHPCIFTVIIRIITGIITIIIIIIIIIIKQYFRTRVTECFIK